MWLEEHLFPAAHKVSNFFLLGLGIVMHTLPLKETSQKLHDKMKLLLVPSINTGFHGSPNQAQVVKRSLENSYLNVISYFDTCSCTW